MSALHENIREFRIMRRITQKDFAAMLSKSRNVISNWERGANSPDPDAENGKHSINAISFVPRGKIRGIKIKPRRISPTGLLPKVLLTSTLFDYITPVPHLQEHTWSGQALWYPNVAPTLRGH